MVALDHRRFDDYNVIFWRRYDPPRDRIILSVSPRVIGNFYFNFIGGQAVVAHFTPGPCSSCHHERLGKENFTCDTFYILCVDDWLALERFDEFWH